jgi:hypothetical protein
MMVLLFAVEIGGKTASGTAYSRSAHGTRAAAAGDKTVQLP